MLVDSHCHLDFPDFEEDRAGFIKRAGEVGVGLMVTISTRVRQFERIRAIAETHENVFCSVGTHPHNADEELDVTADDLVRLAGHPKVVAIGEAGLDYFYDKAPRDAQAQGFRTHIAAARQTGLPLVIHARNADDDMMAILEEETGKGAFPFILHCFSAGQALADVGVRLGGYISFSGIVTFGKSEELREIARTVATVAASAERALHGAEEAEDRAAGLTDIAAGVHALVQGGPGRAVGGDLPALPPAPVEQVPQRPLVTTR